MAENRRESTPPFYLDRRRLGALGEHVTAQLYRRQGYDLLASNYHTRLGELDLVALREKQLVFVEVRTRDAHAQISPAETVDYAKQQRVIAAAKAFLAQHAELLACNMQFDVVEVFYEGGYRCRLHRIENAFTL